MADNEKTISVPGVTQTQPAAQPHLIVTPYYRDPTNGAVYVHRDLVETTAPWADEAHARELGPVKAAVSLGDVESWAAYIERYATPGRTICLWNAGGLTAILDYHSADAGQVQTGRVQWTATHTFKRTPQLERWVAFTGQNGAAQKAVVEFFEDMADTIITPSAADLTAILRTLRANISSKAEVTLKPDGGAHVEYSKDSTVKATAGDIPATITLRLPLLAGHQDADGKAVTYDLTVRLRPSPTENGVVFRFSILNLEASLEDAYADRVTAAKTALGEAFDILRSA